MSRPRGAGTTDRAVRLFLDAGVIIDGCVSNWALAKAVLILATFRDLYTVVLADRIAEEIARATARKQSALPPHEAAIFLAGINGWFEHVRIERLPPPGDDAVRDAMRAILPALRHMNDLPPVVAAMRAQPDWVISSNDAHWNDDLARRSGLRIVTPAGFLRQISPQPPR
jgi:hypothetical protein